MSRRKPDGVPWSIDLILQCCVVDANGCWLWQKATARTGYAVIRTERQMKRVHRLAYELSTGEAVLRTVDVCHRCDVRHCVNPDHLFAGSRADNMRDCATKGRIKTPGLVLKGERCPSAKLTADEVRSIRRDPRSSRELGRVYGVAKSAIQGIRKGVTWRSVT